MRVGECVPFSGHPTHPLTPMNKSFEGKVRNVPFFRFKSLYTLNKDYPQLISDDSIYPAFRMTKKREGVEKEKSLQIIDLQTLNQRRDRERLFSSYLPYIQRFTYLVLSKYTE